MSGASAMRNAVKRVTHKERAQPNDRRRFGLLEKHKDYVERATDYKKKQSQLKLLRKKASSKNPDEFYFEMNNSQTRKGVHEKISESSTDKGVIDLMKTQDSGYILTKKAVDDKRIHRLCESLHMIGERQSLVHKVFVDNTDEVERFDPVEHFQTTANLVNRSFNRPKLNSLGGIVTVQGDVAVDQLTAAFKKKNSAHKELKQRSDRANKLKEAFFKLSQQRTMSTATGTKRKIVVKKAEDGSDEVAVFKWKRQRK